ncbi:MAG: nucleotide exchange factor GrpE [Anaeromyxobacter sp.]|nr:nucleotide exchange factor GrpE [Anaeromyxobacter sp.]
MGDSQDKGNFRADIPDDAIAAALRSVERGGRAVGDQPAGDPGDPGDPVEVEVGPGDDPASGPADDLESLRAQLELSQALSREGQKKLADVHDRWVRAVADLENYKKRAARERDEVQKFGAEKLLKDLLPVMDNLDRALAAAAPDDPLVAGVKLVRSSFEQALSRHGVKAFSAMGQPFDPARHEALMQVPSPGVAPGTVVLEHARGFTLNERLVRPALVGVSVAAPQAPGGGGAS